VTLAAADATIGETEVPAEPAVVSIRGCGSDVEDEERDEKFFALTAEEGGREERSFDSTAGEGACRAFASATAGEGGRDDRSFAAAGSAEDGGRKGRAVEVPDLAVFFRERRGEAEGFEERDGRGAPDEGRRPDGMEGPTGVVGGGGGAAADVSSAEERPRRRVVRDVRRDVTCRGSGSTGGEPDGAGPGRRPELGGGR